MTANNNNAASDPTREIVTTRIFNASPERVFATWASAEHLGRWWGPTGFTTTTHAFDFRPGGSWVFTMHGPDGVDYPNRIEYEAIVPGQRIEYSHHGDFEGGPARFRTTVTLEPVGDRTSLTMRATFPTAAARAMVVEKYGAVEGARQTLARLAELLAGGHGARPELRMTRVFAAPRRLVFLAWSSAEHLARWFTPAPLVTASCELELRRGGVFRLVMRAPDGIEFPMDARFTEVVPNERIEFAATLDDGLEVYTRVTFTEHDGQTTLAVHQTYARETEATRGAHEGWSLTLDQLAAHVETLVRSVGAD